MRNVHKIIIMLTLVAGLIEGASASLIVGVRGEKLHVVDYWQNNETRDHKLFILNTSRKTIVLEAKIVTIFNNSRGSIDSGVFIESDTLAPAEYRIMNYPGREHWKRYLRFIVDGKSAGIIPLDMIDPVFDIPHGKIITNCETLGTHFRNLWLVLDSMPIPYHDKYTFTAIMECKKNGGPDYLLVAQTKTQVNLHNRFTVHEYMDEKTSENFDLMIEFIEYEPGQPCFIEFEVSIENPAYLPFVSNYYFMTINGGNFSWDRLPLIFKLQI